MEPLIIEGLGLLCPSCLPTNWRPWVIRLETYGLKSLQLTRGRYHLKNFKRKLKETVYLSYAYPSPPLVSSVRWTFASSFVGIRWPVSRLYWPVGLQSGVPLPRTFQYFFLKPQLKQKRHNDWTFFFNKRFSLFSALKVIYCVRRGDSPLRDILVNAVYDMMDKNMTSFI